MIFRIITCTLGSVAFGVTMKVPKKSLFCVLIGSGMTSVISVTLAEEYRDFIPCIISMLALTVYSNLCAKILRQPTTIILLPSAIPLLPGSYIYYSMLGAVNGDTAGFVEYGRATVLTGLGIAVGAILGGLVSEIINAVCRR